MVDGARELATELSPIAIIAIIGLIVGTAAQLIALLISVIKIVTHFNQRFSEMELRNVTRLERMETKMERAELDVQHLLQITSKRYNDAH